MNSRTIIDGVKWAGIEFALGTAFRFLIKFVLAKLLLPKDFGLVGMTTIFIAVVTAASELGMGAALIQKKEDNDAENLYNTAFWSGLVWGIVLYAIMCLVIGPFSAIFYNEPILQTLIPVLSIGILLRPLNLIHTVILTRAMNFKKLALINNLSALIAGIIALSAAYLGYGVWALVANSFLIAILTVPLLFYATRWKPRMEWEKRHFKEIFSFGIYSTGTSVFSTITYNIDNLMIGKIMDASALGAYTLAFSLTEIIRQTISSILNKVMYPVFGRLQDNQEKLKEYFLKIVKINALVIYPIMTFMLLFGQNLIINFFGSRWEASIMPLKILSLAVMVHLLVNSFTSLLRGLGYPHLEFKILLSLSFFVLYPGLYFGIKYYGLSGATIAIVAYKICLVLTAIFILRKHIKIEVIDIFRAIKTTLIALSVATTITNIHKLLQIEYSWVWQTVIFFTSYSFTIYFLEKNTLLQIITKSRK